MSKEVVQNFGKSNSDFIEKILTLESACSNVLLEPHLGFSRFLTKALFMLMYL